MSLMIYTFFIYAHLFSETQLGVKQVLGVIKTVPRYDFSLFLESALTHEVTGERRSWSVCSLLLLSCNLLNTNTYAVGSAWTLGMLTTSWTSEQRTKTMVKLPLSVNTTPWIFPKKEKKKKGWIKILCIWAVGVHCEGCVWASRSVPLWRYSLGRPYADL